jgi:transposase
MELELRKHELRKYNAIKDCVENHGNKKRVAAQLGCTLRHVNRLISGFNKHGKQFFVHGNRGRKPSHAIDEKIKENVINLYNTTYADANFTHYCKFLKTKEKINVSYSYVRQVLMNANICSPKTRRKTRKALAKRLKEAKKKAKARKKLKKLIKQFYLYQKFIPDVPEEHILGS